ncbi:MAG: hypothetical protein Q7I97_06185 [Thermovirgaceae bacterium]|nr:hypothetical protein [Thermovirgaceae bacterium]
MEHSLSESMERLKKQAELLREPLEELQTLRHRMGEETERFLSSLVLAAGGHPLGFSWGPLGCVIRKGANGTVCDCHVEEGDEEFEEFLKNQAFDRETAIRVFTLSHREEIIEACTGALEEQRRLLMENIEHIQTLIE